MKHFPHCFAVEVVPLIQLSNDPHGSSSEKMAARLLSDLECANGPLSS